MVLDKIKYIYSLYQNKAFVDAEIGIRNLLKEAPNDGDILRLGALTALSLNQVVTAQNRMMKAFQICPMTAEMANTLGNIYKAAGEWSQAEEAYKNAIKLDINYKPVRQNLIDLLLVSGQANRSYNEIVRQSDIYGANDFLNFAAAAALIKLGRYEEASNWTDIVSKDFDGPKLANLKTQIFFHLQNYEDMRKTIETIPPDSKYIVESVALAVNAYAMQNDWEHGLEIIKLICSDPKTIPTVFVKSINLLMRGGFISEAEKLRVVAESRFNGHVDILGEKAKHYSNQGRYSESCELYKQALAIRPADFTMMLNYAEVCLVTDQFDLCQELIQGAFRQAPNSQFLFALAAILQRMRGGDYKTLYDYDNFIQVYDLQPPDGYQTIEDFNVTLKNTLEEYHRFKAEPLNQSLRLGVQTDIDLAIIDDPVIKSFFEMIDGPILNYMKKIGYDPTHPLKRRNTNRYRINGAWSVRLSAQGHHVNHVHPLGWISSSYYVDVPDVVSSSEGREGWIKFGEPNIQGLNLKAEKYVEPKGGRLVLFPSYMWHGTVPFSGNQTRLTLPFDVLPV